jgi:HSP20 family protein
MINPQPQTEMLLPRIFILEEAPRYLGEAGLWRSATRPTMWRPPTDVYETEEAFVVRLEVAGMREEDFNIAIHGRTLYVRGVRLDQPERRAYLQMEIPFGEFALEVDLPIAIVMDAVQAFYQHGFLKIICPRALPRTMVVTE